MKYFVSKLPIWRQKLVARVRLISLVVPRVSPARVIDALFWTKYAVPRQIKPGILKLAINEDKATLASPLFLLSPMKKAIIMTFRLDSQVMTAAYTADAAAVCKEGVAMSGEGWCEVSRLLP